MPELAQWDSFYVIVGSAAGALIGLQFVVMTLIAERPALRAAEGGAAFATPTIVHLGTALLCQHFCAPHGRRSASSQLFGDLQASVEWRIRQSWPGACEPKRYTNQSSKTGCFILYCRWPRMRCSRSRQSRLPLTRARPCLALERRRCCCFLSEFTTPGTASPTTYSGDVRVSVEPRSLSSCRRSMNGHFSRSRPTSPMTTLARGAEVICPRKKKGGPMGPPLRCLVRRRTRQCLVSIRLP